MRLAREGVLGRFAIDFVVVRDTAGTWTPYAIELNLRKGGTTHPFQTMQFLTDGRYDAATALFVTPEGREKHLVATDHLEDPLLCGLRYDDLFDIVARHGLHFDQARQAGVVFHMDQLPERARPRGPDRRWRHSDPGRGDLPPGGANPARGGQVGACGAWPC
jgi:pheganomycin biosynthesis PGM1-like protein